MKGKCRQGRLRFCCCLGVGAKPRGRVCCVCVRTRTCVGGVFKSKQPSSSKSRTSAVV